MTGPPEPYVPGPPDRPAETSAEPGPPRIYVPGPAPDETELARRLRRLAEELPGEPDAASAEWLAAAVLRDPDLLDGVLERLAAEFRKCGGDAVAAPGPAGWLLGAPLADRTAVPLLALRLGPGGNSTGDVPAGQPGEGVEMSAFPAGRRVFLVDAVLADARSLGAAIRRLEASGHEVVGGAVLAHAGPEEDGRQVGHHNILSLSHI